MEHKKKNKKTVGKQTGSVPTQKKSTGYIMTPIEKRFQVLYSFMKKNSTKKIMVFVSSCAAAKFYEMFMQFNGLPVTAIYGKNSPSEKKNILDKLKSKSGIVVCSEKAKISSLPSVDWMVQFDPPNNFKAYIDRIRKVTSEGKGESLLFITEEELEVIRYLKSQRVDTELIDIQWSKVNNIQVKLERLVKERHAIYLGARQAYGGYVKAYKENPAKEIYPITNIDVTKLAKNFGFTVPPCVDLTSPSTVREEKGKRKREEEEVKIRRIYKPVKKLKIGK